MTETEQLKKNTDEALFKQRSNDLFAWMSRVEEDWQSALEEARKNLNLMIFVMIAQVFIAFVFQSPPSITLFPNILASSLKTGLHQFQD